MEDHVQPIGLVFVTMREWFHCNLKEVRVLVNALSVVESCYFYMKFSWLIQITNKRVRKINYYSQYTVISENILHSILRKERGQLQWELLLVVSLKSQTSHGDWDITHSWPSKSFEIFALWLVTPQHFLSSRMRVRYPDGCDKSSKNA